MNTLSLEAALREALKSFVFGEQGTIQSQTYQDIFSGKGTGKAEEIVGHMQKQISREDQAKFAYLSIGGADGSEIAWVLENTLISSGVMIEYSTDALDRARIRSEALKTMGKTLVVIPGDATQKLGEAIDNLKKWRDAGLVNGIVVSAQSVLHELPKRSPGFKVSTYFGQLFASWENILFYSRDPCKPQGWPQYVQIKLKGLSGETLGAVARLIQSQMRMGNFAGHVTVVVDDYVEMPSGLALESLFKILYFFDSDFQYEMGEQLTSFDPNVVRHQLEMYLGANSVRVDYIVSDHFEREYRRLVHSARDPETGGNLPMPNSFARIVGIKKKN